MKKYTKENSFALCLIKNGDEIKKLVSAQIESEDIVDVIYSIYLTGFNDGYGRAQ